MPSDARGEGDLTAPRDPFPGAGDDPSTPSWTCARRAERARHAALSRRPAAKSWQPARGTPVDAEGEFTRAMLDYCRASGRLFPTWSEVLEVLRSLGYRRSATAGPVDGVGAPPWPGRDDR